MKQIHNFSRKDKEETWTSRDEEMPPFYDSSSSRMTDS
jgi:hypothetical protein